MSALAKHGVALKILAGLVLLVFFSVLGGTIAILSFRQANQAFSLVASTQIATISDAAVLRQNTQAIASLAPGLFARELDDGALLDFTTKMFNQQGELQHLIDKLKGQIGASEALMAINQTATDLFDNADSLSTAIYGKAALQNSLDREIAELNAIHDDARIAIARTDTNDAAKMDAARNWMIALEAVSATAFQSLGYKQPAGLAPLASDMAFRLREAEMAAQTEPALKPFQQRLARIAGGEDAFIAKRVELMQTEREIEDLFQRSEIIAAKLSAAVDKVADSVHADVTTQNETLTATLADRSRLMLLLGGLGLAGAVTIGAFTQMSVIGRLNRLRHAMIGDNSVAAAQSLTRGSDEIAEMAQAVIAYVSEIGKRDEDIKRSSQRLTGAIETLPSGFSLYDADDNLVVCNTRYGQLLYPGIEDVVQVGQSFETVVRKAIERGLIRVADGDINRWVAERVSTHRDPQGTILQQRSDGAWIEIRERRAESGDIVSIYTDVTERHTFEKQLVEAREGAEQAKELADERNRMLEGLSEKLSKYLSPQVYSSIFTSKGGVSLSSSRKKLTIFFSDIASFAETTDNLESEELTSLLNQYLTEMSQIALRHGATIDKYIGDAIMAFFGDPQTRGVQEDAIACVEMAIDMQRRLRELEADWRARGVQRPFRMRIGINTGFCTVGNFGSEDRMDYTIIGSEVNLAARLQAHAELGGILLAHETYALVRSAFATEEQEPIAIKGFANRVRVYRVLDIHGQINGADSVITAKMDGADLRIDLDRLSEADRIELGNIAKTLIARLER